MNDDINSSDCNAACEANIFNIERGFSPPKSKYINKIKHLNILIIDDHRLFADGISNLLIENDPRVLTTYAKDVFSAYEKLEHSEAINLILLSINAEVSETSFNLIRKLKQLELEIPVIIMSSTDSPSIAGLAVEHNASGFISKNCKHDDMLKAIFSVLEGNIYICKSIKTPYKENINTDANRVTKRQQQVLHLLSLGLLNKQIAWELEISENTVKAHLSDLFRHLHVTNRTAAVKHGYDCGLLKNDPNTTHKCHPPTFE